MGFKILGSVDLWMSPGTFFAPTPGHLPLKKKFMLIPGGGGGGGLWANLELTDA